MPHESVSSSTDDRHTVAVLAIAPVVAFDLAIPGQVFARAELSDHYRVEWVAQRPGSVATHTGYDIVMPAGLERLDAADTVIVPGYGFQQAPHPSLLDALRRAHARGARIASICTGAFALAAAGLLDGRRATTHWMHAAELSTRHPTVRIDPGVLYVDDGDVLTSAGVTAGIDLCLHLVQLDLGATRALEVARAMVVPRHREGGQAQYLPSVNTATSTGIGEALAWGADHAAEPIGVQDLARRAHVSARTLHRHSVATTGMTPMGWLTHHRVHLAARMLERPELSIEAIAAASGLGSPGNLRARFREAMGTTPTSYRSAFCAAGTADVR